MSAKQDLDLDEQYDKIYRYCYFRVHSRETAEDITQEAFLRFLESDGYQSRSKALQYLYTIARNLCIDAYRKSGRQGQEAVRGPDSGEWDRAVSQGAAPGASGGAVFFGGEAGGAAPEGLEERLVTGLAIRDALEELEEDAREMILLRYVNEVPVGVIGKIFGISRFAVYRKIRESLAILRERLGEEDFT